MNIIDVLLYVNRLANGLRVALNPFVPVFSAFEDQLLKEAKKLLKPEEIEIYNEHVAKCNYIQRHGGNRQVKLFEWKLLGRYEWKRNKYFSRQNKEYKFLKLLIQFDSSEQVHCTFIAIDGVFCVLSFSEDIGFYKKQKNFKLSKR